MGKEAWEYIFIGQISLIIGFAISISIVPDVWRGSGGLSNYGVFLETTVFYTLGILLASFFSCVAAKHIPKTSFAKRTMRHLLLGLSIAYIIMLASTYPYQMNETLEQLHRHIGMLFFGYLNAVALLGVMLFARNFYGTALYTVVLAGSILAYISAHEYVPLLSHGQSIVGLGFATTLIYVSKRIPQPTD